MKEFTNISSTIWFYPERDIWDEIFRMELARHAYTVREQMQALVSIPVVAGCIIESIRDSNCEGI